MISDFRDRIEAAALEAGHDISFDTVLHIEERFSGAGMKKERDRLLNAYEKGRVVMKATVRRRPFENEFDMEDRIKAGCMFICGFIAKHMEGRNFSLDFGGGNIFVTGRDGDGVFVTACFNEFALSCYPVIAWKDGYDDKFKEPMDKFMMSCGEEASRWKEFFPSVETISWRMKSEIKGEWNDEKKEGDEYDICYFDFGVEVGGVLLYFDGEGYGLSTKNKKGRNAGLFFGYEEDEHLEWITKYSEGRNVIGIEKDDIEIFSKISLAVKKINKDTQKKMKYKKRPRICKKMETVRRIIDFFNEAGEEE